MTMKIAKYTFKKVWENHCETIKCLSIPYYININREFVVQQGNLDLRTAQSKSIGSAHKYGIKGQGLNISPRQSTMSQLDQKMSRNSQQEV